MENEDAMHVDERSAMRDPSSIARRTWNDIDAAIQNLEQGRVGDEFELAGLQDLLNEP